METSPRSYSQPQRIVPTDIPVKVPQTHQYVSQLPREQARTSSFAMSATRPQQSRAPGDDGGGQSMSAGSSVCTL